MKKISIITATFNAGKCLPNLINSIKLQKKEEVEFIIVDGNSTDETLSIIERNIGVIDHYISEPDKGLYDAWNKGLQICSGEWIMFLGADDVLLDNALQCHVEYLYNNRIDGVDIISSIRLMVDQSNKPIRKVGTLWTWPNCLYGNPISHPGCLHSRKLFDEVGWFNLSYKIGADYELLLRKRNKLNARFIDSVTVVVMEGGVSDSVNGIYEHFQVVSSLGFKYKVLAFFVDIVVFLKYFVKTQFRKIGINIHL